MKYSQDTLKRLKFMFQDYPNMKLNNKEGLPNPDEKEFELMKLILTSNKKNVKKNYIGEPIISIEPKESIKIPTDIYQKLKNYPEEDIFELSIYHGRLGITGSDVDGWWSTLGKTDKELLFDIIKNALTK